MADGGKIYIVGFGPGDREHITLKAAKALREADLVVGYSTYIGLVKDLIQDKEVIETGMTEEIDRAVAVVDRAARGETVAIVSSGDAGIYGMAGLVYDVLRERGWRPGENPEVEVVPGVTAISSVASLLGAPVMHDFVGISLSDLLTPWEVIEGRIEAAARADFVIGLYNPKSGRRTWQIGRTRDLLLKHRAPGTPVGIVKSAYRPGQQVVRTDIEHMLDHEIGMLTTLIVGNSQTYWLGDRMVTPRGYQRKYDVAEAAKGGTKAAAVVKPGQTPGERLVTEDAR
jgi:precorrin-3B C17-methyltransferase